MSKTTSANCSIEKILLMSSSSFRRFIGLHSRHETIFIPLHLPPHWRSTHETLTLLPLKETLLMFAVLVFWIRNGPPSNHFCGEKSRWIASENTACGCPPEPKPTPTSKARNFSFIMDPSRSGCHIWQVRDETNVSFVNFGLQLEIRLSLSSSVLSACILQWD